MAGIMNVYHTPGSDRVGTGVSRGGYAISFLGSHFPDE